MKHMDRQSISRTKLELCETIRGMLMRKGRVFLVVGAVLMILLGLARRTGGMILLLRGRAADPEILADSSVLSILAIVLVLIGATEIIAGIGTCKSNRLYWVLGIVVTILFVIDGAINGYFFYGQPGDFGTLVNVIVAFLIIITLFLGRKAISENSGKGA